MTIYNFGSLNIDKVYQLDRFVRPEETVISNSYSENFGGKGLNQSIAISRSGSEVYHIGVIGRDGNDFRNYLKSNNVNINYIIEKNIPNGHAIIQVDKNGQNCIIVSKGSNDHLNKDLIDDAMKNIKKSDLVLLQNEVSNVDYIIKQAFQKRAFIVLNPSPINSSLLESSLEYVNLFILNEIEAKYLSDYFEDDIEILKKKLLNKYPGSAFLLTLGSKGSNYFDENADIRYKAYKVKVKDTTGAGDTFCGYFISSLCKGFDIKECLEISSAASALAIMIQGASSSIPKFEDVEKFIENNKRRD